jgi:hypothetical protein
MLSTGGARFFRGSVNPTRLGVEGSPIEQDKPIRTKQKSTSECQLSEQPTYATDKVVSF